MARPTCETVASQLGQNINKGPSFDHLLTVAQKFQKKTDEVCKLGVEGLMRFAWQTGEQEPPDGRLLSRSSVDKSVITENPSGSFVEGIKVGEAGSLVIV